MTEPRWVPREDRNGRRVAAHTVRKAYRTHLLTLISGGVFLGVLLGLLAASHDRLHPWAGSPAWIYYSTLGAFYSCATVFGFSVMPGLMYAVIRWSERVAYVETDSARAAAVVTSAGPGWQKIHSLGAWPNRRGAGFALGDWLLAEVHAGGDRVIAYALPSLSKAYLRHGLVPAPGPRRTPPWSWLPRPVVTLVSSPTAPIPLNPEAS